ncbi:substrate-binding periplasmic protein [Eubacterium barkeri]|uniref:Amino acid ABC transporter substrate-binding protein, PAAT family n=1 Tax=Eubacterium barkeri TaxID=1528 RepID=A0A1H3BV79_EUBBA|nr:ABC transporter substrate-binding protein [Eubacterium barkeri]SDX45706.1 amino acid ABC transporter substrate-binding protein, PAAT family [Eubacterium barkeri]
MKKKIMALGLVVMLSAMIFAGCGSTSKESNANPIADGKLTIAVDDTYLPMEFRDDQNNLVGFDIDFANALSKALGVEVEFTTVAWDGIFNGLNASQYDAIISSTSITPERQNGFNQTNPYISNGIVIVSRTDATPIASFEALDGKTLGAQIETSADIAAKKLKEDKGTNVEIKEFDGMLDAFSALKGKQIDNIITDIGVAEYYAAIDPETFVVTSPTLTNEPIGITVRKGEDDFTKTLNDAIKKLQDDGTMTEISMKWFKKDMTKDIDTSLNVIE